MQPAKPYTPDTLAERWGCSGEKVRQLVKSGQLPGFRIGRMIRIPVSAVEEYERCGNTVSDASMAGSSSRGMTTASDDAFVLRQRRVGRPNQRP
ncbi:hypothetical protein CDV50_03255 [Haematobacter massiliensis]|uniref:helix-turn-helix domain-containing protein n=1 Tax=Haematobacter massiliensis TaxID=195105 RepID=UPI0009FBA6F2|nr:hypothetical protein CDV50_03255 [Haematobacter massiliensis]OWJ86332.1 hypothetical protein CDV51_10375 [Haematobacter massiliensis]